MLTAKLINSVAAEDLTAAAECLEEGGKPNTLSRDGATAMHIAAGVGTDAVRLMLAYGGDPNVRSVDGSTPLHVAAAWGDRDTLRLLLHNGANPNIMDHEGQRPVDVARSEEHAACVDLLKYYTMLTTVGDEEESPMYTSELIDLTQGDIASSDEASRNNHQTSACHVQPAPYAIYYSSDEEDPINLSGQYCDALSRRLSQLLNDGNNACLDVTSPECPYIGDKRAKRHGDGDKTILAEGSCSHLSDCSCSDTSENDPVFSESPTGCRCHSNHCCIHDEAKHPHLGTSSGTAVRSEQHYFDNPGSPECYDPKARYARNVERRMKQKYFPDFGEATEVPDRRQVRNLGNRSAENASTHCSHSYFRSLSPQRATHSDEGRVRSFSPHTYSSVHGQDQMSPTGKEARHKEKCYHSPSVSDPLNSLSCHHRHPQKQLSSPRSIEHQKQRCSSPNQRQLCSACREECHQKQGHSPQKQPYSPRNEQLHQRQRQFYSPERGISQSELCTSPHHRETSHFSRLSKHATCSSHSSCRSSRCHQKSPSQSPSYNVLHRSFGNHSTQNHMEEHHTSMNKALRKQTTYPPAEKSHISASRSRSPVTIMHVQGEQCCPLRGISDISFPFTHSSPDEGQHEFTRISANRKKGIPVGGSCSSQSVDSGYYEKCIYKQTLEPEMCAVCPGSGPKSTGSSAQKKNSSPAFRFEKKCVDTGQMFDICNSKMTDKEMTDKEAANQLKRNIKIHSQDDSYQPPANKLNSPATLEDGCNIVSSNLRGRNHRPDPPTHSKQVRTACKEEGNAWERREPPRQEAVTDLSISSNDSFQTCEEASVHETGFDIKSEKKSHGQNSWSQSDQLPKMERGLSVYSQPARNTGSNVQKHKKFTPYSADTFKTESLGFSVSGGVDGQFDPGLLTDRKDKSVASFFSKSVAEDKTGAYHRKTDCAAKNIGMKTSKDTAALLVCSNQRPSTNADCLQPHQKSWIPPSGPLPEDSDLFTSDESFMTKPQSDRVSTIQSNNVSKWLQNVSANTQLKLSDGKKKESRSVKRTSDESILSIASSVQEYIYRDKENGIVLIERHIPSDFSGSSSRLSVESGLSQDTDATVSYDWADFTINSDSSHSSSSTFDITAGQTLKSQETLIVDSDGCDEDCCDDYKDSEDENCKDSDDEDRQEDKQSKQNLLKKRNKDTSKKKSETNPPETNMEKSNTSSQQMDAASASDRPVSSHDDISPDLGSLSNEAIAQSLRDLGENPGPVVPSTRQTYLKLLASLQSGQRRLAFSSSKPGYSSELNRLLSGSLDMEDLAKTELLMVGQFQAADGRTWREGTIKSSFNYLLLDPRVTKNLPLRAKTLSDAEAFKTFLSAVFYIGKGKRSRPYCHLYEAISQQKSPKPKVSQKVQQILDIWSAGMGVVSLHIFQNVIPVEAYTREACMVDAISLGRLTNVKKGDYYGVASTWPITKRRCMGAYLLRKAYQIFLSEGERQICPPDIQKGK